MVGFHFGLCRFFLFDLWINKYIYFLIDPLDGPTMSEGVTDDNLESIIVEADFSSAFMKRKRRQIVNTISNQPAQSRKHSFRSEFLAKSEHANCGSRSVDFDPPKREGRIVGGVIPPDGAYPWQVDGR